MKRLEDLLWGVLFAGAFLLLWSCSKPTQSTEPPVQPLDGLTCEYATRLPGGVILDVLTFGDRQWGWTRTENVSGEVEEIGESSGTYEADCDERECTIWWTRWDNGEVKSVWKSEAILGAQGTHRIDGLLYRCK